MKSEERGYPVYIDLDLKNRRTSIEFSGTRARNIEHELQDGAEVRSSCTLFDIDRNQKRVLAPFLRFSGYYAAFVLDPDGNNIEAVFHGPFERSAQPDDPEYRVVSSAKTTM